MEVTISPEALRRRGTRQPTAREGQVGPERVAERPVVPGKGVGA